MGTEDGGDNQDGGVQGVVKSSRGPKVLYFIIKITYTLVKEVY